MIPARIAFRVDASLLMGNGHLMRCLTLAEALRALGAQCHFIGREHAGHRLDLIQARGFMVTSLPSSPASATVAPDPAGPAHAAWLGCPWQMDAEQTAQALAPIQANWLVVDHYALDKRWEQALRPATNRLMAIDDLADRPHDCDLLLDQNLGREVSDYDPWLPAGAQRLIGASHALLRPAFAALRPRSLTRRDARRPVQRLLITLGGVDAGNMTGAILAALDAADLPDGCHISVVMGGRAPWLPQVREIVSARGPACELLVDVEDMAGLMAESDLAIGAAGSTAWERCCLGLPTLMLVLADNQRAAASALVRAGAAHLLPDGIPLATTLRDSLRSLLQSPDRLSRMVHQAAAVTDGQGAPRVASRLLSH